ncbi:Fe-S protein assembly co-chaperone HscB [Roseateles paludis]|jgi:molecular chaperone HscB|uniref:Co-chaperone protein HscB homolog n=1 Tax=Roseateles paludis TaxID=3145238 RepID=A0ABV0G3L8_9BURK
MRLDDNDFHLFGLPERFEQSRADIDARWKALQSEVHPDRFAAHGAAAQRLAMQWAVRVNEARQRLLDPLARAAYLCELRGAAIGAESNTRMPASFLMEQMEWREALDEASDTAALEAVLDRTLDREAAMVAELQRLLDVANDAPAAAEQVRALMFIRRFRADAEARLVALEND